MNSPSVLLWLTTVAVIRCPGSTAVANRRHREYQLVVQEEAPVGTEVGDVASASGLTEKYSMDILKNASISVSKPAASGADDRRRDWDDSDGRQDRSRGGLLQR